MKFNSAIVLSLIAHLGLLGLLVSNFQFAKIEIQPSGQTLPQINARAVNNQRVEQLVEKLQQEKLSARKQEAERLQKLKRAQEAAKQKRLEEERKAAQAKQKVAEAERKRKAEEKKAANLKQKRIKEEQERKKKAQQEAKAEAERKRKAEQEQQRKLEEERKRKAKEAEERRRKEAEEKARQEALEREMMEQMAREQAELNAAHQAQINSELAKFNSLLEGKIKRNWIAPEQKNHCIFEIKIAPGGLVLSVKTISGNPRHCESGERAIYKSEPLPVPTDPDVFAVFKTRTFKLENEDNEN
ncbi:cell envelope integrity protein TolA [Aliikangiella sp. IMCC44653]